MTTVPQGYPLYLAVSDGSNVNAGPVIAWRIPTNELDLVHPVVAFTTDEGERTSTLTVDESYGRTFLGPDYATAVEAATRAMRGPNP